MIFYLGGKHGLQTRLRRICRWGNDIYQLGNGFLHS